jgi:TRAP-type transport system periplasmic protein
MKNDRLLLLWGSLLLVIILTSLTFLGCSSPTTSTPAAPKTSAPAAPATSAPAPATSAPATVSSTSAAASPAPKPPASTPAASAPAANVITLKYAPSTLQPSPMLGQTLTISTQAKLVETRTSGKIKVDVYWSETLAKASDLSSAINSGLADMTHLRPYGEPGKLPLSTVGEMPGISNDQWALLWAYWDLIRQEPLSTELAKFKARPVWTLLTQEVQLISKSPIRTLADLKGKKVAAGGIAAEELKSLGAVTLSMSPVEQSQGLLQGTIDGIVAPIDAMYAFKFYESGKYVTNMALGPRLQPVVINQDAWNKLPADVQKVFNDISTDCINLSYTTIIKDTNEAVLKEFANNKVEVIELSATDKAEIRKIQSAYADKWAADQEAKGLSGKKVITDYRALAAKYETTSPYKK